MANATAQRVIEVELADLLPHPKNPRQGDIGAIVRSILGNGWYGTIVAQAPRGNRKRPRIIAGEHRWRAQQEVNKLLPLDVAEMLGVHPEAAADLLADRQRDSLPVYVVDVDDDTAMAIMLADNRTADLATYSTAALVDVLSSLQDGSRDLLGVTGWSSDDLDDLLADLAAAEASDLGNVLDDARTPAERLAEYEARGIRSIILPFDADTYDEMIRHLKRLRAALDAATNADVIVALIRTAAEQLDA